MIRAWKWYRVELEPVSPLHIGWHDLAFIQRTRCYIPARNAWAVVVSRLAPTAGGGDLRSMYRGAKGKVKDNVRFTPLFPLVDGERLSPRYDGEKGMLWGSWSVAELESEFLFSRTSTALEAGSLTAEEGTLHESEFLSLVGRGKRRLGFFGYVAVREGFGSEQVKGALEWCGMGADRRYGWGLLRLRRGEQGWREETGKLFEAVGVVEWEEEMVVEGSGSGWHLPAHVDADSAKTGLEGELEVVSGRDWSERGSGRTLVRARLCWAPGSRWVAGDGKRRFVVEPEGIWRQV